MKNTLFATVFMALMTLPAVAAESSPHQMSSVVSAKEFENSQKSLEQLMPGYSKTYSENKVCAAQAMQETLQFAENAVFNPFIPYCNGLHAMAGLAIMGGNLAGAIVVANTALLSGCGNPFVVSAIYFEIYDECVKRANP